MFVPDTEQTTHSVGPREGRSPRIYECLRLLGVEAASLSLLLPLHGPEHPEARMLEEKGDRNLQETFQALTM